MTREETEQTNAKSKLQLCCSNTAQKCGAGDILKFIHWGKNKANILTGARTVNNTAEYLII